jgi:hypothetical protein
MKIFRTETIKIIKLTLRPIGRNNPGNSPLLHVDTGPTVSSIFGTLPGCPFSQRVKHPFSFRFIFGNRNKSQGAQSGEYGVYGITAISFFARI